MTPGNDAAIILLRTNSEHPDFVALVQMLDTELAVRDGDDHAFYHQFNGIQTIRHALVAYLDGIPVACGAIKTFEPGVYEVKRMFVLAVHRNQGLASQILAALENWTLELGAEACILETGQNQPEAIRLYEKNGYQRIPNYGQYQGVENSVCFKKVLK
ncbi:MAG: GNAT family N-acetyltransferase [Saprospiraceae bacterium]|nr:GNAT family N-acetyltransferase [Saprospiraceae bacterium]